MIARVNANIFRMTKYNDCLLLFGDSEGCVNIFVLSNAGESLRFVYQNIFLLVNH